MIAQVTSPKKRLTTASPATGFIMGVIQQIILLYVNVRAMEKTVSSKEPTRALITERILVGWVMHHKREFKERDSPVFWEPFVRATSRLAECCCYHFHFLRTVIRCPENEFRVPWMWGR